MHKNTDYKYGGKELEEGIVFSITAGIEWTDKCKNTGQEPAAFEAH